MQREEIGMWGRKGEKQKGENEREKGGKGESTYDCNSGRIGAVCIGCYS